MDLKRGDRIRVKEGVYAGREFDVDGIAKKASKSIGVTLNDEGIMLWLKPDEVEKIK